jgi:hypothetical protein
MLAGYLVNLASITNLLRVVHNAQLWDTNKVQRDWWTLLADGITPHQKALASLAMLTVWEIWNERNARVFRNKQSPSFVILDRIKVEARLWVLAGAKKLGSIMPGE